MGKVFRVHIDTHEFLILADDKRHAETKGEAWFRSAKGVPDTLRLDVKAWFIDNLVA